MTKAYARFKEVQVEDRKYYVEFDGRLVHVSLIYDAPSSFGWTYPFKVEPNQLETAEAIWAAGKTLSNSKWWKQEYKQAGNYLAGLQK